jgi:sugar phosphate isomerase/epimerase
MTFLSLDQLSLTGLPPATFVDIAADAGFDAISPMAGGGEGPFPTHRLAIGDPETEAMKRQLAARGLTVNNLDGLVVMPEMDWGDLRRMVDVALHLGARAGVTLIFDPEPGRAADSFARLTEIAGDAGLPMLLEFTACSAIPSLSAAIAYLDRAGSDFGMVVDVLHLSYAGETPADLAQVKRSRIGSAQICDAPAAMSFEDYQYSCMFERGAPGDGELPLADFLRALPADLPVGVEAPLKTRADNGMPPLERAQLLHERARAALAAAGRR